jgi:hypothetical protein
MPNPDPLIHCQLHTTSMRKASQPVVKPSISRNTMNSLAQAQTQTLSMPKGA